MKKMQKIRTIPPLVKCNVMRVEANLFPIYGLMLLSMEKSVSVNVMDCVSVVLSNSFVKSKFCTVFLFLKIGIYTFKYFFLHLHHGYVLLFSSFIIIFFSFLHLYRPVGKE